MPDWAGIFVLDAPVIELIVRGTIVYLVLLLMLRVTGQREAGGLGIPDLLVVVLAATAVAGGLTAGSTTLTDGLLVVATILIWSVLVDALAYRWPLFARVVKGKPRILVERGRANRPALRREFMSDEELHMILRVEGIERISEVKVARLESNGMISVVRAFSDDNTPVHGSR